MVILTVAERNFPLLQFLAALLVKLQAPVTGSAGVIPKDISHVVQHTNHICLICIDQRYLTGGQRR